MASESTDERVITVRLPDELDDWLGEQAEEFGATQEDVLVQMLASYRATSELDGELEPADAGIDALPEAEVKAVVEAYADEVVSNRLGEELDERAEAAVEQRLEETLGARLSEATDAVQTQLTGRIDAVEGEFQEKIEDVRERVIQVKQETDSKAPRDHEHEEFDRLTAVGKQLDELERTVDSLENRLDGNLPEQEEAIETVEERVDTIHERLQTVAWVVNDLREAQETNSGPEAVDRIKRAAAEADVGRAQCESCGEGVEVALLTDPNCPHCEATVTDVRPASGFFSKPQLLVASQLEAGEQ